MHPHSDPPADRTPNLLIKSQLLRGPRAHGKAAPSGSYCDALTSVLPCSVDSRRSVRCWDRWGEGGASLFSRLGAFLSIEQNPNTLVLGAIATDSDLANRVSISGGVNAKQ